MRKLLLAALAVGTTMVAIPPAMPAQGCGPGFQRGYYGRCRPIGRVFVPGGRVGVFYPGRGWWYGGRYWGHRYSWHGGWRYR